VSFFDRPKRTPRALARSRPSPPRSDGRALELGEPAEDREHELAVRSRGVGPGVLQGAPERMRGYCILAVAAGCRDRGFAGFFAAGSSVTTTGLGLRTGEGAVVKLPSDMVECTVIVCGT
jgi:hypothetical protein